jgi:hypothetical protein
VPMPSLVMAVFLFREWLIGELHQALDEAAA